ncbi:unnamed protein product [Notodromas monacha]|uniref:NXF1/2/3/5-like leucine-rich repeat domain-containing protein n=1 Tax=Notodromas monacha TaxID=399045 RepID=A0A7R9BF46_9CRUS|nr:unnamed protein product [Notodromas monacha]CAG0913056.1 unnamed protein product [Notodromas monacha]
MGGGDRGHRGYSRRGRGAGRDYNEHDNRDVRSGNWNIRGVRRSVFKPGRNRAHTIHNLPEHLLESDVAMDRDTNGTSGRFAGRRPRGNFRSRTGRASLNRGGLVSSFREIWCKVQVNNGKDYGKIAVVNAIRNIAPSLGTVYNYRENSDDSSSFYTNEKLAMDAMRKNPTLLMHDSRSISLRVFVGSLPDVVLDPETLELLAATMSSRYDVPSKFLNLSSFDEDKAFKEFGILVLIRRDNVLKAVTDVIKNYIPETEALDLSNNRGLYPDKMCRFRDSLPNLKRLAVRNNAVSSLGCMGLQLKI